MTPRERRLKTYPHRYGPGKVHRYIWSYERRAWIVPCSPRQEPHGREVDPLTPVDCKYCDPNLRDRR